MIKTLIESLLAPAVVAAFVAFFVNNAIYHNRQKGSYRNDLLDKVRAYIKIGVEMAVEYFSTEEPDKRIKIASKIQIFDADLREDLVSIRTDEDGDAASILDEVCRREVDFLSNLTGGSFGSEPDPQKDREQIRKIIASGVFLRKSLRNLRQSRFAIRTPLTLIAFCCIQLVIFCLAFGMGVYFSGLID